MDFTAFVKAFWKKLQWSGKPWEPGIIATVTGLPPVQVDAWWKWCQDHGGLTDDNLVLEWELTGLEFLHTPFGDLWTPRKTADSRKVSEMTVAELDALLLKHIGK